MNEEFGGLLENTKDCPICGATLYFYKGEAWRCTICGGCTSCCDCFAYEDCE